MVEWNYLQKRKNQKQAWENYEIMWPKTTTNIMRGQGHEKHGSNLDIRVTEKIKIYLMEC